MTPELKVPLAASAQSPAEARRVAARFLAEHGVPEDAIADAALVVSELVTNAVFHGAEPVDLVLVVDEDRIVIKVTDAGPVPEPFVAAPPGAQSIHGRGLAIVAAAAPRWGAIRHRADGKTIWAELDLGAYTEPVTRTGDMA